MATETLYNYDPITPTQITREQYTNVGSSSFQLGDAARGFKGGTDFEIWDSAVGGTQLVEDTDYEIQDIDSRLTPDSGFDIYTRVRIINATYQTGNIYVTYKTVLSYVDAVFYNALYNIAIAAGGSNIKYLTSTDSPFTITDGDGYGKFICDTSSGDIDIVLPTLAGNPNRELQFIHQTGGNLLTIDGESSETIDGLTSIELPKQHDRMTILGTTAEWGILEERISAQLVLDTFAGYGSIDNKIIRFTNSRENYGNMFLENHSTGYNGNTEGLEITISKSGKYSFTYSFGFSGTMATGFSLNSTQLVTNIDSINIQDKLSVEGTTNSDGSVSITRKLDKNNIVRLHSDGATPLTDRSIITVCYIGN